MINEEGELWKRIKGNVEMNRGRIKVGDWEMETEKRFVKSLEEMKK